MTNDRYLLTVYIWAVGCNLNFDLVTEFEVLSVYRDGEHVYLPFSVTAWTEQCDTDP
jgi:hypothetical protein